MLIARTEVRSTLETNHGEHQTKSSGKKKYQEGGSKRTTQTNRRASSEVHTHGAGKAGG
jgi:hypothetical protein